MKIHRKYCAGLIVAGIAVLMFAGSASATVLSPEPCNIMLFFDGNLNDSSVYGLNDAVVNAGSISYSADHPSDQPGTYQTYNYAGNQSIVFDGVSELKVVDVPTQNSYDIGHLCDEQFSAELWFKTSHESGGYPGNPEWGSKRQILINKVNTPANGYNRGWGLALDYDGLGLGHLSFFYNDGGNWHSVKTNFSVIDGQWHHAVGTLGPVALGTFDQVLYVDGVERARVNTGAGCGDVNGDLWIGGRAVTSPDYSYTGLMDEVRIQAYAMSPAKVLESYENSYYYIPEPVTLTLLVCGAAVGLLGRRKS